ncbi:MAG: peptidase M16 [Acidimicrobiia bacterium]
MRPSVEVKRFVLDNGLRVVLAPDPSSTAVAIAVYYGVGFRSETKGKTGFAHLFEHLMFQGSQHLEKLAHFRLVQGNGGTFNGSTHDDFTNYFELLPPGALELGLFLEADRMAGIRLDEDNLRNQVDVVKEEVRLNVLNRPYGGFPWLYLPMTMFRKFENGHNSYGDFRDLEAARVEDAAKFFETYYTPSNAVLAVAGRIEEVRSATRLVRHYFEEIPDRARVSPPDLSEPIPKRPRRRVHVDPKAPEPALALGFRVPNPQTSLDEYVALGIALEALTKGRASRLYRSLVKDKGLATSVSSHLGLAGHAYECRDPSMAQFSFVYKDLSYTNALIDCFDEVVEMVGREGFDEEEIYAVKASGRSQLLRSLDSCLARAMLVASLELIHGDARVLERILEIEDHTSPEKCSDAVGKWLRSSGRAILEWHPGSGPGPTESLGRKDLAS